MDTNKDSLDSRDSWSKKRIKDIPRKSPPPARGSPVNFRAEHEQGDNLQDPRDLAQRAARAGELRKENKDKRLTKSWPDGPLSSASGE